MSDIPEGLLDEADETTLWDAGVPDCGHCGKPMEGYAAINDVYLCHPDEGASCYMLVSGGHPTPCGCMSAG